MAYCFHITRGYIEPKKDEISINEWKLLVNAFPYMELIDSIEGKSINGKTLSVEGDGMAVFKSGPREINFSFFNGTASTSATDNAVEWQMHRLAYQLNAEVRGDEGELYEPHRDLKVELAKTKKLNLKPTRLEAVENITKRIYSFLNKGFVRFLYWGFLIILLVGYYLWLDNK
jgi:uncharacterized beta-barrel protein YwiB (DUF1934 family)